MPIGDCYIEYWGLDSPQYNERRRTKIGLFRKYDFRVISLNDRDLEKLDDLLRTQLLKPFPMVFVSNRFGNFSLIERLKFGDSPCDASTRQLTMFGLFADANQPHVVYSGHGPYAPLSARTLSGETKCFECQANYLEQASSLSKWRQPT